MQVKITNCGCNAPCAASLYSWWWRYLCEAANGIITWVNSTKLITSGVYELPDEDWSYDNPRFTKENTLGYEEIEIDE